ncbi:ABC transporter ATP-binding protein [Microbacterium protaetiae]|nr:ABC transporter ATP-binding protein [Microbacterium protaetiae]
MTAVPASDSVIAPASTPDTRHDALLELDGVSVGYDPRVVVADASFSASPGTVTTIIGPNGSGKSTLLRAIGGLSRTQAGVIRIDGVDVAQLGVRALARRLALLPQSAVAPDGLTVADLVSRGRQPHQRWYRQWTVSDERATLEAMERMDVATIAKRPLDELSGGQRQRAWIAMCLAQDTSILVLDEPTTHLDMSHAVEILETVRRLARESGRTILTVLHDLSLAARYSDRLVVVADGAIQAIGDPVDILTPELMRDAFHFAARVFPDPFDGTPTIAPAGL